MPRRLRFNAFTMNCVSHIHHGQWRRPDTRQLEYTDLDAWIELAKILEKGKFDAIFLADVIGTYNVYGGNRDAAVEEGLQTPVNDPSLLVPALATATENIGFAFTQSILQEHPFNYARRLSTLDHLTKGRVGWNVVTSYLEDTGRNLGYGGLPPHDERYERADEYLDVIYKLLEGSWDDDAVIRDTENGVYADPSKIHNIDHVGTYFDVVGPHVSEPSPQRTPILFQAGASPRGRSFAAKHAEAIFIAGRNPQGAKAHVDDVKAQAIKHGRNPDDILFYQGLSFVVGGTEAEAKSKAATIQDFASARGYAAHFAGAIGVDLAEIDLDEPIGEIDTNNVQGVVKGLVEAAPDKTWTFGDVVRWAADTQIVGTPEQIADELQQWHDAGVDGINLMYHVTPGSFEDFIDGVIPVLQERGLAQREYAPGTLREKLTDGASGPRLNDRHPAAARRRTPAAA